MNLVVRSARISDVPSIHQLIVELAIFEKAPEEMVNTVDQLTKDGFGQNPSYICFVAELDGVVVGISLCYVRYSTWKGRVLYLEDLIVTEKLRGNGIGKSLFEHTLNYSRDNGFYRLQWQVLDWNESAIDFYKAFDAEFDGEWLNAWVNCK